MAIYLFDLDGTMYHGTKIVPEARLLVEQLIKRRQAFYFLTNNASRTPAENVELMKSIGFSSLSVSQFFNSAMACVSYTAKHFSGRQVMMIGQAGLAVELAKHGFSIVREGADLVMVGLNQSGNYQLYSLALRNLLAGAVLIGTNQDRILLNEEGANIGNGSVIKLLEYASGQEALITGKPSEIFLDEALAYWQLDREEVIIVGDNLETDILCGLNAGVKTIFVLGGVHDIADIDRLQIKPDRIISTLKELI